MLRRCKTKRRRGAAAVEFAVCLPVLTLMVFGSIEASTMMFLKQTLNVAAYEASREATRDGRGNGGATTRPRTILEAREVKEFTIRFPAGESFDAKRGDEIIVEVSAPSGPNSPLLGEFISNRVLISRVVMVKQ